MIGFWLRSSILLSLLLLLPVLLVHTQPSDAAAIRALLTPPDCDAPCFLGIQPGETDLDDAFVMLNAHPWVAIVGADYRQFVESNQNSDLSTLRFATGWQWSRTAPDWIDIDTRARMGVSGNQISNLSFYTTLPLGTVVLAYDVPDIDVLLTFGDDPVDRYYIYRVFYADLCLWVQATGSPLARDRYEWPAQVIYRAPNAQTGRCDVNGL